MHIQDESKSPGANMSYIFWTNVNVSNNKYDVNKLCNILHAVFSNSNGHEMYNHPLINNMLDRDNDKLMFSL
jgi:hypothetical protein